MQKGFTLLQTIAISGVFSAVSGWYGFMFGRESARKELGGLLRCILFIGFDCNVLEALAAQVLRKSKMMQLWTTVENDPSFLVEAEITEDSS
ncbi:hypothetical protein MTR67_036842 [Solanum verrucosum]|uniref:Uncharacterized protein n=1 Tax=Solanum verrucosum TaxID=315347 RepID=A0AAF0ZLH6_SOLVR|nr:hypothetical protein MTR67_036842 [Solanum verrucosum]